MTGKTRILLTLACGATLLGGAAWAERGTQPTDGNVVAQETAERATLGQLVEAARLEPLMRIVATEGARHGLGLEGSLFPGRGGEAWATAVSRIQSPDRLMRILTATLDKELGADERAAAMRFYRSSLGSKITEGEVTSRRAMLDAEVEASAMKTSADRLRAADSRATLVRRLIETLDLVTSNVTGGLNANYAFYRGLDDGGAMRRQMSESEMLALVWGQEKQVRKATRTWLHAYLNLAYERLTDEELSDYIAFVETPAGRRMNAALFAAFGRVFEETSYEMGLAAARFMATQDI
ncbi:DUF2059 domain-containing protein [Jannaschia aquimarina]|uniref:DUF2059 domain-containing protein n=1 Tax=Jannaschia aquimarina TaxID=935700 RepID=A0A0D1EEX1_9RHOB|nr:DUF2059 domain-containing protein [Jannaschia aquimarina]KIT16209.1 hypothetical protein jaqu_20700 [Jannaschia aquimarina]SNT39801.1 hypothetical protein SAMN05421775_1159 [Jannaschia aquimarina]